MRITLCATHFLGLALTLGSFSSSYAAGKPPYFPSSQNKNTPVSTRIVGGQPAQESAWPWMTAYVVTFQGVNTTLRVDNQDYDTSAFNFAPAGTASGEIVSCGIGDATCASATNKVCLIERGEINFSDKAINCEAGGGVGAIIYNNEPGQISGTLGNDFTGTIPVVAISQDDGLGLLNQQGAVAVVAVSAGTQLQQDSSCGASFLGDKWVLTAAHCVDSANARQFKMNVGEYDLSDGAENAINIANIYIHPQYNADAIDFDIALVELVESVNAPAVQLASKATTEQYSIENSPAMVAGWGGRVGYAPGEGPTYNFPDVLHQVELNLTTNAQCRTTLANSLDTSPQNTGITERMICATQPASGKGSCQGDSGGPLIVQTGIGPQQVGIVSWGIGCAEPGYPGVYTRVAEFSDWLNAIQNGIAITQKQDFGIAPVSINQSATLELVNNSELNVDLSFSLSSTNIFSLGNHNCSNLAAGASCQLSVNLNPVKAGDYNATVTIRSGNAEVPASSALLQAQVIANVDQLAGIFGTNNNVNWYSGGNKIWGANPSGSGVQSGAIDHNQQSILSAYVQGKGKFNFQWSVSSEENEDDPNEPFDALYLYVNNELQTFISGDVEFSDFPTINLDTDSSIVTWVYQKDPATVAGDDTAYVRNVVFTPNEVAPPSRPPVSDNSGGGGSLNWWILCFLVMLSRQRILSRQ